MYDFAARLEFLPFVDTSKSIGKRFANAGFDYSSFILNSTDIIFLYLLTLANFFVFKLLQRAFKNWSKGKKFLDNKLKLFDAGNFIELYLASFMILYLCSCLNVKSLSFSNWLESIQSLMSISVFTLLSSTPIVLTAIIIKNKEKI